MLKGNQKVTEKRKEKIPITFNEKQIQLIELHGGMLGNTKAEIIRNIVINWLIEKEERKNEK